MQAQAAVRAEDGNAFPQRVERLALYVDERVVKALQREPLGDVLIQVIDTTFRRAVGDDVQRAPIW